MEFVQLVPKQNYSSNVQRDGDCLKLQEPRKIRHFILLYKQVT